jgi:hypothetical protein
MRTRALLAVSGLALGFAGMSAAPASALSADLDCADFATQAQAQANLVAHPSDPNNLDADNDGQACETFDYQAGGATAPGPSTQGKPGASVSPMPQGGVATGSGSTAGLEHEGLLVGGGVALLLGAGGLVVFRRRLPEQEPELTSR